MEALPEGKGSSMHLAPVWSEAHPIRIDYS